MTVKAGSEKATATEIAHGTGQDIASDLADKRYASVKPGMKRGGSVYFIAWFRW